MSEVTVDGQTVAYDRLDAVPPWRQPDAGVIFVHGVGADRDIWCDWIPVLSGLYPLVRLDLPGHGKSAPWPRGAALSFDFYARLIETVADREGFSRIILIGESMGGTIALNTASVLGDRVRAVATCSTAHRGGTLRHVQAWRDFMTNEGLEAWSRDMLDKRFLPGAVSDPVRDWFHGAQCRSDGETILTMAEVLVTSDLSDRLGGITAPVLLMQPDSSPFIPLEIPVELKGLLPDGRLKVIPSAKHGIACSHGAECAAEARSFFEAKGLA